MQLLGKLAQQHSCRWNAANPAVATAAAGAAATCAWAKHAGAWFAAAAAAHAAGRRDDNPRSPVQQPLDQLRIEAAALQQVGAQQRNGGVCSGGGGAGRGRGRCVSSELSVWGVTRGGRSLPCSAHAPSDIQPVGSTQQTLPAQGGGSTQSALQTSGATSPATRPTCVLLHQELRQRQVAQRQRLAERRVLPAAVAAAHVDGSTQLHEPFSGCQCKRVGQRGGGRRKEGVERCAAKRRFHEAAEAERVWAYT